jgi:hypothetical protein
VCLNRLVLSIFLKMAQEKYPGMHHAINLWSGRIIPVLILGTTAISVWVIPYQIASVYLLQPPNGIEKRPSTAIAILVLYFVLFFPYLLCYIRLLQTMLTNTGYTVQRLGHGERRHRKKRKEEGRSTCRSRSYVELLLMYLCRSLAEYI